MRPIKLCRHVRDHGWEPVILCDCSLGQPLDPKLVDLLPQDLEVHASFSPGAARARRTALAGEHHGDRVRNASGSPNRSGWLPSLDINPELVPFGEHLLSIPWALRAGRRLLRRGGYSAIVASIDPHAAGEVGLRLSRESGVPLVLDFRDPWSVCELRRPLRPAPIRRLVDRLERRMVHHAAAVVLNTETTREDYRRHYPEVPAGRFHVLRNMNDPTLCAPDAESPSLPHAPLLLFLGNLRRFLEGGDLFALLGELRRRGGEASRARLVLAGKVPEESWRLVHEAGLADRVVVIDPVPLDRLLPLMERSALLLVAMNRTTQRFPAKFFDYCLSSRPMLAFSEAPELNRLIEGNHGRAFGFGDVGHAADFVEEVLAGDTAGLTKRHNPFTAAAAARVLATILDKLDEGAGVRAARSEPRRASG